MDLKMKDIQVDLEGKSYLWIYVGCCALAILAVSTVVIAPQILAALGNRISGSGDSNTNNQNENPFKIINNKHYLYKISDPSLDIITYVGITNDPARRHAEHIKSGKILPGDLFSVIDSGTRHYVRGQESRMIFDYRERNECFYNKRT